MTARDSKRENATVPRRPRKPKGPGRLSVEDAAQIEGRILDAAIRLFARDGFGRTRMDAIAREAGASTKTLYDRYANKDEVLGAVAHRIADRILAAREDIAANPAAADPQMFLLAFGKHLASRFESREMVGILRVAVSEAYRVPRLAEFFVASFTRNVTALRRLIEAWHKAGKLPMLPPDPQEAARIFLEMAMGIPRIRALVGRPLTRKEADAHVTAAVDLFLRGCGYRASGH